MTQTSHRIFPAVLATFFVFLMCCLPALGQSTRGELAGQVTDSTGAAIPNASISAKLDATGGVSETVSSSSGGYHFTALPIGTYTVRVSAPGFSATSNTGVQIQINSTASLNIVLAAGAVTETVSVDASGARVEAESSDLGGTISARQITELPLAIAGGVGALRSPENFVFLVPGTTGPGSGGAQGLQGNGVFFSKLAGGQSYGAEILLDGASVTRSENGSSFDETAPSVEALQEFKVTTSTPSAEFGRTTSGIESFVTKTGTNAYHGTGFDIFKNEALDANGWFETALRLQCAPGDVACRNTYATPLTKRMITAARSAAPFASHTSTTDVIKPSSSSRGSSSAKPSAQPLRPPSPPLPNVAATSPASSVPQPASSTHAPARLCCRTRSSIPQPPHPRSPPPTPTASPAVSRSQTTSFPQLVSARPPPLSSRICLHRTRLQRPTSMDSSTITPTAPRSLF